MPIREVALGKDMPGHMCDFHGMTLLTRVRMFCSEVLSALVEN